MVDRLIKATLITAAFLFGFTAKATYLDSIEVINFPVVQPASQSGTWNINSILNPISISGSVSVTGGLTDSQLRATPVPISGTVSTGGLTDVQLRASAVSVSLASVPTHPVTQSGVWGVGINAGSNVMGSISNTGFNINGTLPAFAATPTFNIGTGAFVDRTTAAAPYAQRLSDGTAFYDARSIRSLVFSTDKVDASGSSVSVSNFPPTQAVSGTVSISGTPNVNVTNASIPVTGAFFQATQPVSIASSVAVTGPLTDTQLRAVAVPVSGAFFQATQPVSIASIPLATNAATDRTTAAAPYSNRLSDGTVFYDARSIRALTSADIVTVANPTTSVSITGSVAVTGPLTDGQLRASAVPVSLTSTTISNFPANPATSTLQSQTDTSINTLLKPASTLAAVTTVGTITNPVTVNAGTNLNTSALNLETTQSAMNAKFPTQINGRVPVQTLPVPNDLIISTTAATGVALTATLPAVAANFHYIDAIEITLYSTLARTGSATPIVCTTTNLPGSFAVTWATAGVIGAADTRQLINANRPIKSSVVNTATTIVCPVVTGGLWRINVVYSTGI